MGHLDGNRPVVEQQASHGVKRLAVVLANQQGPLASAIHEQIALDAFAGVKRQCRDVPVRVRLDLLDIARDVAYAELPYRMPVQQRGEFARIEVIAIVQGKGVFGGRQLLGGKPLGDHSGLGRDEIGKGRPSALFQPISGGIQVCVFQRQAEGMTIAVCGMAVRRIAVACPSEEPGALLEAGIGGADHLVFGEAEALQGRAHRRPSPLADADGRYVGRLHEHHPQRIVPAAGILGRNSVGGYPSGGAAPHHHNRPSWPIHRPKPLSPVPCEPYQNGPRLARPVFHLLLELVSEA